MDQETQKALNIFYSLQKELSNSDDTIRLKQVNQIIAVLESNFYSKIVDIHKTLNQLKHNKNIQPDEIEVDKETGVISIVPSAQRRSIKKVRENSKRASARKNKIPKNHDEFKRRVEALCGDREQVHVKIQKSTPNEPLGFSVKCSQPNNGVYVEAVAPGGIGENCGLEPHDQILAVDGLVLDDPDNNRQIAVDALRNNHSTIDIRIAKTQHGMKRQTNPLYNGGNLLTPNHDAGHIRNRSDIGLVRDLTTEYTQYEIIDLETRNGSFGFGITAGLSGGVMVRTILNGGSADMDGRLQINDHIMYINEICVRNKNNSQVAEILKANKHHVKLIVARPFDNKSPVNTNGRVQMVETVNLDETLAMIVYQLYPNADDPEIRNPGYGTRGNTLTTLTASGLRESIAGSELFRDESEDIVEHKSIILPRTEANLGMTVRRIHQPDVKYKMGTLDGVFVENIEPNSIADRHGIKKFDKIIAINGKRFEGDDVDEAMRAILSNRNQVEMDIVRYIDGPTQLKLFEIHMKETDMDSDISETSSIGSPDYRRTSSKGAHMSHPSPLNREDKKKLIEKWKKKLGDDYDIVIAEFSKFTEDGGIGLSLEGTVDVDELGHEKHPHHYIRSILPTGPAGKNGFLKEHDELLEANDTRIYGLNHMNVIDVLKNLPIAVRIVCARIHKTDLAPLYHNNGDQFSDGALEVEAEKLCRDFDEMIARESGVTLNSSYGGTNLAASGASRSMYSMRAKSEDDGLDEWGNNKEYERNSDNNRARSLEEVQGLAVWDRNITYVDIEKKSSGLGFSVLDHQDPVNPNQPVIVVRSLVPNGAAAKDGRIFPGDRLMSVNDVDVSRASVMEAVEALKNTKEGIVRIGIVKAICFDKKNKNENDVNTGDSLENLTDDNCEYAEKIQSPKVEEVEDEMVEVIIIPEVLEQKIRISKLAGQKLGLILDKDKFQFGNGFFVHHIESASPLDQYGVRNTKLCIGDLITKINGVSIRCMSFEEVNELIQSLTLSSEDSSIHFIPESDYQVFIHSKSMQDNIRS